MFVVDVKLFPRLKVDIWTFFVSSGRFNNVIIEIVMIKLVRQSNRILEIYQSLQTL